MTAAQMPAKTAMNKTATTTPSGTGRDPSPCATRPTRSDARKLFPRTLDFHRSPKAGPRRRRAESGRCLCSVPAPPGVGGLPGGHRRRALIWGQLESERRRLTREVRTIVVAKRASRGSTGLPCGCGQNAQHPNRENDRCWRRPWTRSTTPTRTPATQSPGPRSRFAHVQLALRDQHSLGIVVCTTGHAQLPPRQRINCTPRSPACTASV